MGLQAPRARRRWVIGEGGVRGNCTAVSGSDPASDQGGQRAGVYQRHGGGGAVAAASASVRCACRGGDGGARVRGVDVPLFLHDRHVLCRDADDKLERGLQRATGRLRELQHVDQDCRLVASWSHLPLGYVRPAHLQGP